jgi:hypothetical protein
MGRRRTNTAMQDAAAALADAAAAQTNEPDDDLEAAEISDDVLEGLRRLDQGGGYVTWFVYCESPVEREGFIEKLRTEQLDEQRFKSKYGPGEYKVIGRTTDGHYVKGSHKVIKISGILADEPNRGAGANDVVGFMREKRAADEARQKARADDLKHYASVLAAPFGAIAAALIARRPSVDIAALVTALKPAQAPPTLSDMTTALVNLKTIQGDGGGGGGSVDVVLKVLERLQDLPQGQSEGGWLGFLRDVIKEAAPHARELIGRMAPPTPAGGLLPPAATSGPAFGPGVGQSSLPRPNAANGASAPTSGVSEPSPSSPSAPSANPPPSGSDAEMWAIAEPWLRRRAEDLLEWAGSNMEVELCAEMLLASVPKVFRAVLTAADLVGYLQRPDWWAVLTAFHPPLQPYHAWIDDLRGEVLQLLAEEINGPPADTSDHGTTQ